MDPWIQLPIYTQVYQLISKWLVQICGLQSEVDAAEKQVTRLCNLHERNITSHISKQGDHPQTQTVVDFNKPFSRGGVGVEVLEVFWEELWLHFFWPTFWLHCILYRIYTGGRSPP